MNNKKAVINQVFVYIMSTIAIIFVGFLVIKFIVAFTSDSNSIIEDKFIDGLKSDINQVASRYSSEEILDYRLDSDIKNVCFIPEKSCASNLISSNNLPIEESEILILAENSNFLTFNQDGISSDESLSEYTSGQANECFCIKPNNGKFKLLIENRKNRVFISDYS